MTEFRANGVKLNITGAFLEFDIQSYYAVVRFGSSLYIPTGTKVEMKNDSTVNLIVLSGQFQESFYYYTCVSEDQYDVISSILPPVQGDYTVIELLSNLGLSAVIKEDSVKTWWSIPSGSFKALITALNKWAEFSNGGAPRFFLDIGGNISWCDFILSTQQELSDALGDVELDNNDVEWMLMVPGSLKLLVSDVNRMETETVEMCKEYPCDRLISCDHTTRATSLKRRAYENEFNYRKYTSRVISLINVQSGPHFIGQHVKVNGVVTGVVSYVSIPLQMNKEVVRLKLRISCLGLLEQK